MGKNKERVNISLCTHIGGNLFEEKDVAIIKFIRDRTPLVFVRHKEDGHYHFYKNKDGHYKYHQTGTEIPLNLTKDDVIAEAVNNLL